MKFIIPLLLVAFGLLYLAEGLGATRFNPAHSPEQHTGLVFTLSGFAALVAGLWLIRYQLCH